MAGPTTEPAVVEVRAPPLTSTTGARDASVAGSTVRRSDLERPGLDAADALRTEVGAAVTETGGLGAAATASIRGATSAQTPVYLGGVRLNDDVAGAADLSTLPLWLIDRVEIYRGNAPFEADRYGIGGAIFFEPLRPRDLRAAFGASGGSYGSRGAWAYATAGDTERGVLLGLSTAGATNDYTFTDRGAPNDPRDDRVERMRNADATLFDVWLIGRSEVGSGRFELLANHFEREQGAPHLAGQPTFEARQSLERTLGSILGRAPLGENALVELRTTSLVARSALDDPRGELLGAPGELVQRGERVEQELGLRFGVGSDTRVRVAALAGSERLRRYEAHDTPGVAPVLDAERVSARIAGTAEHDFDPRLSLRALLALECHSTTTGAPGNGCDTLEPVGRLGALARTGELSAFAGIGHYARPPTLGELYGTSLAVHGNPALVPEQGLTFDAGARFAHRLQGEQGPLYAAASGYFRRASDLVSYVLTSQNYVTPENVAAADVMGLELEAGSGFAKYLRAEVAVTLADFRDRTPGSTLRNDILPYHSRLVAAPRVEGTTPRLGSVVTRAALGARLLYQSNRYADPAGSELIPEQTSVDLDATLIALDGKLTLRGRVADLFDAPRWDIVGFPLPRRSIFVSIEVQTEPRIPR